MKSRSIAWAGLSVLPVSAAIGAAWMLSLPPAARVTAPPAVPAAEKEAIRHALTPRKRQRPVIAAIGINDATETTDYLMPYGILRRADVADVVLLATHSGPVTLYPALTVVPNSTLAAFDAQHPEGADYVIVPAMSRDDDPVVLRWLREQRGKGAIIIGVCAGAKVVAAAGLLDGKRATTHWYYLDELRRKHPSIRYVADRRFVVDAGIATTTGISASMPMALTLVDAIGGRAKADAVAREIGLRAWDAHHASSAFQFTRPFAMTALTNVLAFWKKEDLGLELVSGFDEVSLALLADAWSRTYRSTVVTFSRGNRIQESRNGVRVIADRTTSAGVPATRLPAMANAQPARTLDGALDAIADRYGTGTGYLVAMQLEYRGERAPGRP